MNTVHTPIAIRRLLGIIVAGGALVLAAGCGHNSIVGKWQNNNASAPLTIEFTQDGKEIVTQSSSRMTLVINATYVAKDDKLQVTPSTMTVNGQAIPVPSRMSTGQSIPFKLDGDSLTMTLPGRPSDTLTRVKS